ncbi:MAG: CRTAC1 family protein [Candidatus Eisenbacteria bacterium]|nr:CRTAC1 family protein [Candidatus Eisenbacteria bacterium]
MHLRHSPQHALTLCALLAALAAAPASAQTFAKVTDPANPIVTLGSGPGGSFIGSAWVDTDNDGDLDLFIVRNGLFRNDGAGVFVHLSGAIASQGLATGTTWADVDNDGDLDCYVAGGAPNGSALYRNQGGNVFAKVTSGAIADTLTHLGWAAAFGDYDSDGWADLVLAAPVGFNGVTGPNRLLHADGGGAFSRVDSSTVATGVGFYTVPSWCDWDGDGDLDLSIGSGSGGGALLTDYLYRNRHETTPGWLQRYLVAPLATDLHDGQQYHWVDYDDDGDLDVYLTNFGGNANTLYANTGGGVFVARTSAEVGPIVSDVGPSLASIWEDFDNDGDQDCYVTNAQTFAAKYYRNDGGTFTSLAMGTLTGNGPHWGATAGDYDGDGAVDLYVNGNATAHGLYRNTTAGAHHWLDVKLRGTISNRSALGARVRVRSMVGGSPRWQMRHVSAQNSFNGMSRLDPHFGLAEGGVVDTLVVEWPSGMRSTLTGVAADQTIEVIEPTGVTAVTASLVESSASPDGVRSVWQLAGSPAQLVAVERDRRDGEWIEIAGVTDDGAGRITVEDADVQVDATYRYRLVIREPDGVRRTGTQEIRVPGQFRLAIRSLGANPGRGPIRVEFEVPGRESAELELFDPSGRRVDSLHSAPGSAGRHAAQLGARQAMRPGVYLVRLRQNGSEVTAKVSRVE